jgi:hypothetical protein
MENEYHTLRNQADEIFKLIDRKCYDHAEKSIGILDLKFMDHTSYVSELSRILEAMKDGIQATDYINQRKKEYLEKKKQLPSIELQQEFWDTLTDFEMHIVKPKLIFK